MIKSETTIEGDEQAAGICFLPAGDENTASSRLRVFTPVKILADRNVPVSVGYDPEAAVVVVQKCVNEQVLRDVRAGRSRGQRIIFDVDDSGDSFWHWTSPRYFFDMLCLADLVTVDTPERAEWIERSMPGIRCEVIPNPVDYSPAGPVHAQIRESGELRVLWFGNPRTFVLFQKWANRLSTMRGVKVLLCGASQEQVDGYQWDGKVEVTAWSLGGILETLQACDLVCLTHFGRKEDARKSNHKMTTSVCWGVPAVVSATPDYMRAAEQAGINDAVFSNEEELCRCVDLYRDADARKAYLDHAQERLWKLYSPEKIVDRFQAVVEMVISEPAEKRSRWAESIRSSVLSYLLWRWRIEDEKDVLLRKWFLRSG